MASKKKSSSDDSLVRKMKDRERQRCHRAKMSEEALQKRREFDRIWYNTAMWESIRFEKVVRQSNGKITKNVRRKSLVGDTLATQLRKYEREKLYNNKTDDCQIMCNRYFQEYRLKNHCKDIVSFGDIKKIQVSDDISIRKGTSSV